MPQPERSPDRDVPEQIARHEKPEEIGGTHGDASGGWRILRNSMIIVVAIFVVVLLVYNFAWV